MAVRPSVPAVSALRARYEQRSERLTTLRHVQRALVSLAGLIGRPVVNQAGGEIGRVVDVVARWDGDRPYPPVTGLIVRVGRRRAWLPIEAVEDLGRDLVRLRTARLDLRDFTRRHGEVELGRDVVSEFAGIAAALGLLHVSRFVSVPVAAVAIWALVVFGSYKYAERLFLVLSLVFFAYPISAFLSHPDCAQAGAQLAYPHFLATKAFLLLVVALIGTTINPYMQFYVAAAVADRGIGPDDYGGERIDTVAGSIFCNLISIFIITATAAAIKVRAPLRTAKAAAEALTPVAGRSATQLFAVGLLGASALAAAVVPLSTAYAINEATGVERSVSKSFREAPVFLGLFTAQLRLSAGADAQVPASLATTGAMASMALLWKIQ